MGSFLTLIGKMIVLFGMLVGAVLMISVVCVIELIMSFCEMLHNAYGTAYDSLFGEDNKELR